MPDSVDIALPIILNVFHSISVDSKGKPNQRQIIKKSEHSDTNIKLFLLKMFRVLKEICNGSSNKGEVQITEVAIKGFTVYSDGA